MITIGVIITCFNRREKTIQCLTLLYNAFKKITNAKIEIFLLDDNCTDGTSETVKKLFSNINIIQGDGNLFWNRGMNLAWKEASKINPDFYLWLNDDTFLFQNSLNSLLESSYEKKNQAIIVGSTISGNDKAITYGGLHKNNKLIKPNGELQRCNYFNGNIVLIPKIVFKKNGYLDNIFHHALGDFDYGLRAEKMFIESYVATDFLGICEGHITSPKWFDSDKKTLDRLKSFYSSTCGSNPIQLFKFENRHHGLMRAIKSIITNHLKVFNPNLFNKFKNS